MDTRQIKTVHRLTRDLVFSEYNPRKMTDEQYHQLKESLLRFGFVDPVIVNMHPDRKNVVVGGHQRVRVARDLGIKEVPCVEVELPLDRERELNIRLNKNLGGWDWDQLADLFGADELMQWGFDEGELTGQMTEELSEKRELLTPYRRAHVLISFSPDVASNVKPHIDGMAKIDGVEIEQSAN